MHKSSTPQLRQQSPGPSLCVDFLFISPTSLRALQIHTNENMEDIDPYLAECRELGIQHMALYCGGGGSVRSHGKKMDLTVRPLGFT